jgi:hypothetical protein
MRNYVITVLSMKFNDVYKTRNLFINIHQIDAPNFIITL